MTLTEVEPTQQRTGDPNSTRHAEDPNRPGWGLCGVRRPEHSSVSAHGHKCVVCVSMTQRSFSAR